MAEANYPVRIGRRYQKALTANANSSSFASKIPTITEPANDGVIDLIKDGCEIPEKLRVLPYGLGANNDAFSLRVIGWRRIASATPQLTLWVPTVLCEVACTMGQSVGIAASPVLNTEAFCDTITIVSEPTVTADVTRQGTVKTYSPANDTVGWLELKLGGVEKIEFTFDQTTNTPTTNCLIAFL